MPAPAKENRDGAGTTHAETTVEAADTLTLISGRDTTLEGAQAIGERVVANVGRNLTMTSQQDGNDYDRADKSAGIDVAVGFGGGGTASGYYNQSDVESTYTSVNEQTGIQAGEGGFDIQVGGHTELTGAAIASTADPSLNRLSTQSLSVSDLHNETAYDATSFGASVSGGTGGGSVTPSLAPTQSDHANSITRAGISAGTVDIRNGDQTALDGVDRSVTELQQSGLGAIFDEQKVAERMEMGQVAGQVGMRTAGDLADQMGWEEGSHEKVILHGVVGAGIAALGGGDALQGLSGAALSQKVTGKMQAYLKSQEIDPNSSVGRSLMELGSLAIGAAVGGSSGGSTALSGEQFNRQLHLNEAEALAGLIQDASPEEAEQLRAAACALVNCASGVPIDDPNYAHLVELQQVGSAYVREQETLKNIGLFTYSNQDVVNDWLLGNDETTTRLSGVARGIGGAAGAVGATGGAVATSPACVTVAGCIAPIGLAGLAAMSAKDGIDGLSQALGPYQSTQGARVLSSFDPVTHMGKRNAMLDLGLSATTVALQATIFKVGGKLLASPKRGVTETSFTSKASAKLPPLRQAYVNEVRGLKDTSLNMRATGDSPEQIARQLHKMRRDLGVKYKSMSPPAELDKYYARNLEKHGDKLGPSVEWLRSKGKSWEQIIESASRPGGSDLGF